MSMGKRLATVTRLGALALGAAFVMTLAGCGNDLIPIDDPVPTTPPPYQPTPTPTQPPQPPIDPPTPTQPSPEQPPIDVPPTPTEPACERPSTFFADADGDGFGDDASTITACAAPAGYVEIGGDCMDSNPDVHPSQTGFFTADRGDGSFDYDCDGTESLQHKQQDVDICICGLSPWASGCGRTEGWAGAVPACGQPHPFNHAKRGSNVQTCEPDVTIDVQGCR